MDVARLILVGCGKMGGALLRGWLERGMAAADVHVVEPGDEQAREATAAGVQVHAAVETIPEAFRPAVVVFAVKPQVVDAVVPAYRRFVGPDTVFLSIAAGKTIERFEHHLGAGAAVVRAMPNTPAAVGRGMIVVCANAQVSEAMRERADGLMAAVGEVAWIDDEELMDAVTAVSGSGPAYVFLLIECLAEAGVQAGLPAALAEQLARVTVSGAGELARLSETDAATLRRNVTSPGGTTAAALEILMREKGGLNELLREAVEAARRRSQALAD